MSWQSGEVLNTTARLRRLSGAIPSSYTIFKIGDTYYAETNIPGGTDYSGANAATVIKAAIDACSTRNVIAFKGNFDVREEINISKPLTLLCSDASFTWAGATATEADNLCIFKTDSELDGLQIYGGRFLSNQNYVWPLGWLRLKNSLIKDVTVNHTIRSTWLENVKFQNITQLGSCGDHSGLDWGVNIVGRNVTVDGFYCEPSTWYHGGMVINGVVGKSVDNIVLKNVYFKGVNGSFVQWYLPKANTQYRIGKTLIQDFYYEVTSRPPYANFGVFTFFDSEGSVGMYSGDYGKVKISKGTIKGAGLMTGSTNGIKFHSLLDFELGAADGTADVAVEDVDIENWKGYSDTVDYMVHAAQGKLTLRNVNYNGDWEVQLCKLFKNLKLCVTECKVDVAANTIGIGSGETGSSEVLVSNCHFSSSPSIAQGGTHTYKLDYRGNNIYPTYYGTVRQLRENYGEATGAGADTVTIPHSMAFTPNFIQLTDSDEGANPYVSASPDATNIYVKAVAGKKFKWYAVKPT